MRKRETKKICGKDVKLLVIPYNMKEWMIKFKIKKFLHWDFLVLIFYPSTAFSPISFADNFILFKMNLISFEEERQKFLILIIKRKNLILFHD